MALRWCEIGLDRDLDACWRALCDVERLPEWVPNVSEVRVLERDDEGRARLAQFIGGRGSSAFAYRLRYEYDDAAYTQRWQIADTTLRDLDGEAVLVRTGATSCRLRYGLHASAVIIASGAIHLRDESPEPVVAAFKAWVEG